MNRRHRRVVAGKPEANPANPNGPGAGTAAACYEAGLRRLRAERYLDAQICCRQALAIESGHAGTLHLMGLLSLQAQQYDHAVEWFAGAIRQNPEPEYLLSLGTALRHLGRREEALKVIDKAVQLKPSDADSWRNLGEVLVDVERPADAILAFQQALKLKPRHWDAANKCGTLFYRLERFGEALIHFNLCDEMQPDHVPTLQMRALATFGLNRFEEALGDMRRAHAIDPTNANLCSNMGVFLRRLGREEEALPWFDKALELKPGAPAVIGNKAFALTNIHRFKEAFAVYRELKAADPGNADADYNMSLLHLLTGNSEVGWPGREARRKVSGHVDPSILTFPQPMWLGKEPVAGKTLLINADEGLGDSIQFARYVPMLAARGARVILVVQDALLPLLSGLSGVAQCIPRSAAMPTGFDFYCPICSLPAAFDTRLETIPSATPYLPAPGEARLQAWENHLGPHDRPRIGLVWSGNPKHTNDQNRSIPLQLLARILDVDATFVSLQKDPRPSDKAILLERTEIVDPASHLTDFAETAALISCLDLLITVDTSVAHLAGALGRPTWILLPYTPDYRWLLDRDDSPWYPTARLFRQTETRDYGEVLDRVRRELAALISATAAATPTEPTGQQSTMSPTTGLGRTSGPTADRTTAEPQLYEAGLRHLRAEAYLDAQLCCQQALAADADHADTLHLMGLLSFQARQYDHAVEWITRAIRQNPKPEYLLSLGVTLRHQGRAEEARQILEKAVQLRPEDAGLWKNLGDILQPS